MPFSKVQSASNGAGPATVVSLTTNFLANVTKGNLIAVFWSPGSDGTAVITDTQGNVYTAGASTNDFGAGSDIHVWYAIAGSTGPCSVTIKNNALTPEVWQLGLVEYNVPNASLDQSSGIGVAGFGTGQPPAIVTGQNNTLIIAAAIATVNSGASVWGVNGGFTIDSTFDNVAGFNASFCMASLNAPLSGTNSQPTFTNPGFIFGIDAAQISVIGVQAPSNPGPNPRIDVRQLPIIHLPTSCCDRELCLPMASSKEFTHRA